MSAEVLVRVRLNWTEPGHYDPGPARPCRCCGTPTHMRDNNGLPCEKGCAEDELVRELLGVARTRITDERIPSPAQARTTRGAR